MMGSFDRIQGLFGIVSLFLLTEDSGDYIYSVLYILNISCSVDRGYGSLVRMMGSFDRMYGSFDQKYSSAERL